MSLSFTTQDAGNNWGNGAWNNAVRASVSAGDLIILLVGLNGSQAAGGSIDTPTDDAGNTWTGLTEIIRPNGYTHFRTFWAVANGNYSNNDYHLNFTQSGNARRTVNVAVFTPDSGESISYVGMGSLAGDNQPSPWITSEIAGPSGNDALCICGLYNANQRTLSNHEIPTGTAATGILDDPGTGYNCTPFYSLITSSITDFEADVEPSASGELAMQASSYKSAPSGYTLAADPGNIDINGSESILKKDRKCQANTGILILSGIDAQLNKGIAGYTLQCEPGTFSTLGLDISPKKDRLVSSQTGAITAEGPDTAFRKDRALIAQAGNITTSGIENSIRKDSQISSETGNIDLRGLDAELNKGIVYTLQCEPGAIFPSGLDANPKKDRIATAEPGTISFLGVDASPKKDSLLSSDTGIISVEGVDTTFRKDRALIAQEGTIGITGLEGATKKDTRIASETGAIDVAGLDSGLQKGFQIPVEYGLVLLSGQDAIFKKEKCLSAESGIIVLSGTDATFTKGVPGYQFDLQHGSIKLAGSDTILRKLVSIGEDIPIIFPAIIWPRIPDFKENETYMNFKQTQNFLTDLRQVLDDRDREIRKYIHQHK